MAEAQAPKDMPVSAAAARARSRWILLVAAAILVAGVVGAALWMGSGSGGSQPVVSRGDASPQPAEPLAKALASGPGVASAIKQSPSEPPSRTDQIRKAKPPVLTDAIRQAMLGSTALATQADPADPAAKAYEPTGKMEVLEASTAQDGWQQLTVKCEAIRRNLGRESKEYPVVLVMIDLSGKVSSVRLVGAQDAEWDLLLK